MGVLLCLLLQTKMGKPRIYAWTVSAVVWLRSHYDIIFDVAGKGQSGFRIYTGNAWSHASGICDRNYDGEAVSDEILGLYGYAVECTRIYLSAKLSALGRVFDILNPGGTSSGRADDSFPSGYVE